MLLLCSRFLYILFNLLVLFSTMTLFGDDTVSDREDMRLEERSSLHLLAVDGFVRALDQRERLVDRNYRASMTNFNFGVFISFLHDLYQHDEASFVVGRYQDVHGLKVSDQQKDQIHQLQYILKYGKLTFFTISGQRIPSLNHYISLNEHPYDHINRVHIDLDELDSTMNSLNPKKKKSLKIRGQNYHLTLVIDNELNITSKLFISYQRVGTSLFINTNSFLSEDIKSCSLSLISDADKNLLAQTEEFQILLKNIYKLFGDSVL